MKNIGIYESRPGNIPPLLSPLIWAPGQMNMNLITPAHGSIRVFSLPHACLAGGLINLLPDKKPGFRRLSEMCALKWGRNTDAFLHNLEMVGINDSVLEEKAKSVRKMLIGWIFNELYKNPSGRYGIEIPWGINPDIALTVAVLSRCVEGLLIGFRSPDYSWDTLFSQPVAFEDPSFTAIPVNEEPWNRFDIFEKRRKKNLWGQ